MAVVPYLVHDEYCPAGYKPFQIDTVTGERFYTQTRQIGPGVEDIEIDVASVMPVQEILDDNQKRQYNAKGSFTRQGVWGAHAASVPIYQMQEWLSDDFGNPILDDVERAKILRTKLNDSDNRKFRVAEFNM